MHAPPDIYTRPAELTQNLIRFDTTNPPGNEDTCVAYVQALLEEAGIETTIKAKEGRRANLIARLPGRGDAPPLLLQGHVDVVTTANQSWRRDPFGGEVVEGYVWGRGALDMKGSVAMMLSAVLRAKAEGLSPAGDIVVAVLADEEQGGNYGAKWLVEEHPELFEGVRYSIGEAGGFTTHLGGRKFYPIQVAEKQICYILATVRGPGGHGSVPTRGGAMSKLGRLLTTLDTNRLPVHVTPVVATLVREMAEALPPPLNASMLKLLDPATADSVLEGIGPLGRWFDAMLHNTVNATIVKGGHAHNVIPSEITVQLDGRLLPGFTQEQGLQELRDLTGDYVEYQVIRFDSGPGEADMGLYGTLSGILAEADPEGIPVPFLLNGVTDGRHFARLGIQNYGWTPLLMPDEPRLMNTVHDADERVPVEGLEFGAGCMYRLLQRYGA